jgi:hypothetical protein
MKHADIDDVVREFVGTELSTNVFDGRIDILSTERGHVVELLDV